MITEVLGEAAFPCLKVLLHEDGHSSQPLAVHKSLRVTFANLNIPEQP
jgi:hypothetical protein